MGEQEVRHRSLCVVFAGGGTGGHLFPAIAIADEINKIVTGANITFIGTRHKIEAMVVPQHGYGFKSIWVSGFRRRLTIENLLFPVKFVVSLMQSLFLMIKLKPDVVVGTGGYVCGPPLFVATLLGLPTLIQEQNSFPGVTTRLLASRVNQVHLSFKSSQQYLKRVDNTCVSGNPTRASVGTIARNEGAAHFGIDPTTRTLLVFGGSQGAASINKAVVQILDQLVSSGIQVLWQTGETDYAIMRSEADRLADSVKGAVKVYRFVEKMEYAYAACDLAVCRSGATTIAELAKAGVPSILVPYPFAAADHQTENAKTLVMAGAALMIRDSELSTSLLNAVRSLLNDSYKLQQMKEKVLGLAVPNATSILATAVLELSRRKHGRA
jgi:UDP-N-acetylglucosamine--N-acetylmuramyl-(pentapeptide) pyrophosphoryl-undecaprenol N-acetylglucosamine transferase